ncbi:proline dehydrogenase domain protein [Escherichia coli DEC7A]|nr:proline dehydrogenase domain protein [Escherichia coli DEC7A]EHW03340.1 proline dehydrogenase domain protein [Escherichia coli DEC7E]
MVPLPESVLHRSHWPRQKAAQVAPAEYRCFPVVQDKKNRLLN